MVFGGIQKLTLLDYPDKTACTLFTIGCNFNCTYCQNSSLIETAGNKSKTGRGRSRQKVQSISESEVLDFLKTRKGLLDGVCISGGEPLIQDDLEAFICEVRNLGFSVKLDTNGSVPQKLEKLIVSDAIDYIAMDIKNSPEKYALTTGLPGFDISPVKESKNLLLSCKVPFEFRTTVVREFHTEEDLLAIAGWISGTGKYFIQSFKDSEGVLYSGLHNYSNDEMYRFLENIRKVIPSAEFRGD